MGQGRRLPARWWAPVGRARWCPAGAGATAAEPGTRQGSVNGHTVSLDCPRFLAPLSPRAGLRSPELLQARGREPPALGRVWIFPTRLPNPKNKFPPGKGQC